MRAATLAARSPLSNLLAAAGLALALAGCNSGMPGQPAAARPSADPAQVFHRFAQCVRDHGVPDFPDPVVDAQGHADLPPNTQKPPAQAMQACGSILDPLLASSSGRSDHPDPAMMRKFAQCMRDHGIDDWPDPDAQGRFRFPPSLSGNIKSGPRWPQIQAAWTGPCKQHNPSGRIEGTE